MKKSGIRVRREFGSSSRWCQPALSPGHRNREGSWSSARCVPGVSGVWKAAGGSKGALAAPQCWGRAGAAPPCLPAPEAPRPARGDPAMGPNHTFPKHGVCSSYCAAHRRHLPAQPPRDVRLKGYESRNLKTSREGPVKDGHLPSQAAEAFSQTAPVSYGVSAERARLRRAG